MWEFPQQFIILIPIDPPQNPTRDTSTGKKKVANHSSSP